MTIDMNKLVKVQAINDLAQRTVSRLATLEEGGTAIKAAALEGNALKFFNTSDTTQTAAYTFNLPAEKFLDTNVTNFVPNFNFSTETYIGATNPNLENKPVFVLGEKTVSNDGSTTSLAYSFIDVSSLVDIYTASDTSVTIKDYKVAVKVSSEANNAVVLKADGVHVDVSDRQEKDDDAIADNIAKFDLNGNAIDGGIAIGDLMTTANIANDSDVSAVLSGYFVLENKINSQLTLSNDTVTLAVGNSDTVVASRLGAGAIAAISADTEIATVEISGLNIIITGVADGSTTITVSLAETDSHAAGLANINVTVNAA